LQGEQYSKVAAAIREGDLDAADLAPRHRLLLEFVETLTRHAYRITDKQVDDLREVGWTDAQIAEAVYDGALFNLFVRLADAFDIHPDPSYDAGGVPGVLSKPAGA
jgi:alkylhydroperoxidase family enzyme